VNHLELKKQKLKLYEEKLRLRKGLPHLYGHKMYEWQEDYYTDMENSHYFLCAANQIGKSSIQIRKRVHIATSPELWPKLWPRVFATAPNTVPMSWYLYPNQTTVMDEFREKWIKTILPAEDFKDHPIYGWKSDIRNKILHSIVFNTGYTIYFKTYNQSVHDLQAGTAFAIDCDEELPMALMPELQARLFGTDGAFSMAFTATLGQDEWRRTIEEVGSHLELYTHAWKRRVSVYDCLVYADGSDTPWTEDRIQRNINSCTTKAEVQRRIFGHFVKDSGLKYPQFKREKHIKNFPRNNQGGEYRGVPKGWNVYSGVDYGSGGKENHPSAIVFLAVNPELTKIRLIHAKRFDKIDTTQADLYDLYCHERGNMKPVVQVFDWAAKDFGTIASRCGDSFRKAEKSHEAGEAVLSSALKSGVFIMYDTPEVQKLAREFEGLGVGENKRRSKDDLIDAVRYTLMAIPIDWATVLDKNARITAEVSAARGLKLSKQDQRFVDARPSSFMAMGIVDDDADEELDYWNDLY